MDGRAVLLSDVGRPRRLAVADRRGGRQGNRHRGPAVQLGAVRAETNSISWTFPGQRVSGCGNADLTCTVILAKRASAEWQWGEFHVTMPRVFFVDSPGSNCAGQHLCAGFATNAWSFVGVPPSGTPAPLPPDRTRLCIGSCGRTSLITPKTLGAGATALELTAGCGGAGASAAQAGAFCPVKVKTTGEKKQLTEAEKIQEAAEN